MPYTVAGTLKLPETGQPAAGVILKFIALQSISPVLDRSESVIVTSPTGAYSIQLEYNTYSVFATLYDNKPINCGQVVLNSTVATGLDLPTLLNGGFSEPTTPSWIVELQRLANVTTNAAQAAAASAAASSTSAAAAAASAAQASQISGLSTVAEAIGLAAIPLPDVWAPLSDSLRMITGYGREVKVGDDVIARMLTFSRSTTKTYTNLDGVLTISPVNAPTFDRLGLLLEGQSQNLVVQSEKLPRALEAGAYTISPSAVQGYNLHSCVYNSGDDALVVDTGATLQAADGTGSFVFNSATIVSNWSCYFNSTDSYVGFWPKNSSAFEYEDLGKGLIRASRKLKGTTLNVIHIRCGKVPGSRIDIGCYQIESLPVASSYIPTSGSVSTRTADLLTLQNPLNIPPGAGDMTVAFEVRRNPALPSARFPRIFNIGTHTWLVGDSVRFAMRGGTADQGQVLKNAPGTMETVVYRIAGDQITVRCGNAVAILTRTGAITWNNTVTNIGSDATGAQNLFGYVRNLRVWRRALTDDQMKAIA